MAGRSWWSTAVSSSDVPQPRASNNFYKWIQAQVGQDPSIFYAAKYDDIPTAEPKLEGNVTPATVPIWYFSFSDDAGLTGAPELEKTRILLGLVCAYGFETSDEVLKLRFPAARLENWQG